MKHSLLLITLVTTQVLGDIWLSQGMKLFGAMVSYSPAKLWELLTYLLTSPWIILGVSTLTFSMVIYLIAIAEMDISYVLPIHGFSYVLNALMAWLILGEKVSFMRWLATFLITLGVLIVGWSKNKSVSSISLEKSPNSSIVIVFPFIGLLPKVWLGAVSMAIADATGDLLTAKGMKQIGAFPQLKIKPIINWIKKVISSPFIIGGISCQALSFLIFLSLLSWADISLVRPATAIGYIISLLGAKFILHEQISQLRWLGIAIIGGGMGIISVTV
jgi:drug/metabolite transporter (DMT)-like permease